MDGSGTIFVHDAPYLSSLADEVSGGILYIEDFDLRPAPAKQPDAAPPAPAPVVLTSDDLDAARSAGRAEGMAAALADAALVQAQLQTACLQTLADALGAARTTLERVARLHAEDGMRTVLAVLQAAIPAAMARHAAGEAASVLQALLPGLVCEPELRVRAHPDLADIIRETLVGLLPRECGVLSVASDTTLAQGDVQVAWLDGRATRDTAAIWNDIRLALAPLGLAAIEEICCGSGH